MSALRSPDQRCNTSYLLCGKSVRISAGDKGKLYDTVLTYSRLLSSNRRELTAQVGRFSSFGQPRKRTRAFRREEGQLWVCGGVANLRSAPRCPARLRCLRAPRLLLRSAQLPAAAALGWAVGATTWTMGPSAARVESLQGFWRKAKAGGANHKF